MQAPLAAPDRVAVRAMVSLLLLAAFFPYVELVPLGTDTQPYALIIAAVLTGASVHKRVRRELVVLFFPFGVSLLMLITDGATYTGLRSVSNYASIAVIPYAVSLGMRADRDLFATMLRVAVYGWLAAACLQIAFGPDVLVPLLPSVRTSGARGVTSLAPEPTHYGMQCLFMLLLVVMEFRGARRVWLAALLIAQVLLFARSAMAGLFLVILVGLYLLTYINSPRRILFIALLIGGTLGGLIVVARTGLFQLQSSRLFSLGTAVLRHPTYLFLVDASGNQRFSNILFSVYGFLQSGMVPHGFGTFADYVSTVAPRFQEIIAHPGGEDRIMSGYGAALFELGVVGAVIPAAITVAMWRFYRAEPAQFILYVVMLHLMLLTAIPLANPIIGVIIGYAASERYATHELRQTRPRTETGEEAVGTRGN